MEIRELNEKDFEELFSLVSSVYSELPVSMWFEGPLDKEVFGLVFQQKIMGVKMKSMIDIVAIEKGSIIGEFEAVRVEKDKAIIGVIVSKRQRGKGVGRRLLEKGAKTAEKLGVGYFDAEVGSDNQSALVFLLKAGFSAVDTKIIHNKKGRILLLRKEL